MAMQSMIQVDDKQPIQVMGPLTFKTTPELWLKGNQMIKQQQLDPVFDLKGVTTLDSSSLALLIGWVKQAKKLNRSVQFLNVPTQLHTIAKLSGFDSVISQWTN